MKRSLDVVVAFAGLAALSPLLLILCGMVWLQDRHSPFYIPVRVGKNGKPYRMFKLRSMIVRADKSKVDSTANNDPRITAVGRFIRRCKCDEIPQLWNVLKGEMSLVGPRPNVQRETDLYTGEEQRLLSVAPGITDISSIVFADEGSILEGRSDPDLAYNQLIRPYKSRLGLLYIDNRKAGLDLRLLGLTVLAAVNRRASLDRLASIVQTCGGSPELIEVTLRREPLRAAAPPGAQALVTSRAVQKR